ncbi:LLM class flavin-dependent oxidoreductase [Catenulispora sp. NF23]|uniref:LLM class flavin-dependent oxidoreductase n=1 Tax=Catenulispora pinistramenti TaxID=2705254 RepID=A0ABS5KTK2_9ACTN|nr:LLM class flavin-dependent oxidoreductase [Catenulispora pinistramenti]MBS2533076.1 LLM class flavin-dependent oxidoreductase [Catenulispora pinistramenti]MBS2549391.1 LLM class flavin-dependent oxidoreductase [Catenulispora pinistramenti]
MTLRFGAFIPPFHSLKEDPTSNFWRDLDLVQWLDELGLDEVWIGEHHSGGWSTVSSPEVFLAAAAERTKRIKLGTGVVSLPYHHPLTAANRVVQLDHQSRGRVMFGMGAGVSPADAHMMGIAAGDQRRMMSESLEALVHLLHSEEPLTMKTDWFELNEARLHLRPYQKPCFDMMVASAGSERGMRLAGRHGLNSLTFAGRPGMEEPPLAKLWQAAEEEAAAHGKTVDRDKWRVAICVHVADTRAEALAQVQDGMANWFREYVRDTIGAEAKLPEGREAEVAVETRTAIIGSVDDAVEAIGRMLEDSGGFGTLLVNTQDWATREQTKHSYELLARYVAPNFNGALDSRRASQRWVSENRGDFAAQSREAARSAGKS